MAPKSSASSRWVAIFATYGALLASVSAFGCSSGSSGTGENVADDQGDGGVVQDAGPAQPGDHPQPNVDSDGGCPMLTFPSGVNIQTKTDAKMTAEYADIADDGSYPLPTCFIDTDDLRDPISGNTNDIDVMVGKHFALSELVGTELPYGHKVLLAPTLVAKLDAYRDNLGESVNLSSGYRSPAHQRAVCQSLCGHDSCSGTCAARSRHSWGDAADHAVAPSAHYANAACSARFNYVFREGDHMHLDLNPDHAICTVDIL